MSGTFRRSFAFNGQPKEVVHIAEDEPTARIEWYRTGPSESSAQGGEPLGHANGSSLGKRRPD